MSSQKTQQRAPQRTHETPFHPLFRCLKHSVQSSKHLLGEFHSHGGSPNWMDGLFHWKSHLEMDDNWDTTHFRTPSYLHHFYCTSMATHLTPYPSQKGTNFGGMFAIFLGFDSTSFDQCDVWSSICEFDGLYCTKWSKISGSQMAGNKFDTRKMTVYINYNCRTTS